VVKQTERKMKLCKSCKHYQEAEGMSYQNDRCLAPEATYFVDGVREERQTCHYTCNIMLDAMCKEYKLWQPKLEVA
jgi:hypothetical protein